MHPPVLMPWACRLAPLVSAATTLSPMRCSRAVSLLLAVALVAATAAHVGTAVAAGIAAAPWQRVAVAVWPTASLWRPCLPSGPTTVRPCIRAGPAVAVFRMAALVRNALRARAVPSLLVFWGRRPTELEAAAVSPAYVRP